MRSIRLYSTVLLLAASLPALAAAGSAAPVTATTPPSAKIPDYMAGLDPEGRGSPEDLVRRRWGAVLGILRDKTLDTQTKQARVEKIVTPVFDFAAMTRLALGRANWSKFSAAQRKEFSDLFIQRLRHTYGKRITGYEGENVAFKPAVVPKSAKPRSPSANPADGPRIVHVPVALSSTSRTWTILHKFRKIGALYRIYDVEIEGISILRSFRAQFDDVLRRGAPEDLLARLRKPLPASEKDSTGTGPGRP